jgi:hypothetical protein
MILLGMAAAAALMVGVFMVLARGSGPTRSVAHVLYDAENPTKNGR